ncbi:hypothetical protein BC829DRAFT_162519 [Chytridium lagenaria]|nr:hypothetical protein BC829DRAFT_162519 [Chytridium lagenaria]
MMSLGTIDFGDDEMVPEGLHLMLREVFKLDAVLMVELCAGMSMGMKGVMTGNPKNKLKILLSGLYDVHCHLLPTSRALFDVEKEMGKLTTAQAMVVIRDQVMLQRVTAKDRRDSRMFFPGLYRMRAAAIVVEMGWGWRRYDVCGVVKWVGERVACIYVPV